MKIEVYIRFRDGLGMLTKPQINNMGIWYLDDDIVFNCNSNTVYKRKGNVICGENITSTVEIIKIFIQY